LEQKVADNNDTKSAQDRSRAAITSGAQKTSEALQEGAGRAADAAYTGSDIADRGAVTVAETVRHLGDSAGETARRGSQRVADTQQRFAEAWGRDFDQGVSKLAHILQQSAQDWSVLIQLPGLGGGKLQEASATMSNAVERVIDVHMRTAEQLFRMSGPVAIAELQQQFIRRYLHALLEGSTAIVRAVRQIADQTLRPLEQHMSEHERQHRNGGDRRMAEQVSDVMSRDVKMVGPDETVRHVAQMMREEDTGVLPVAEGDRLVGMLTDRDVAVRLVAEGRDPGQTKVRDVMTSDVRYVFEDEDLEHVAENMAEQQVRRLPVMNRQKRLVGVVSVGDIAKRTQPLAGKALSGISREQGQHSQVAAE